jgi:hypothetical protein
MMGIIQQHNLLILLMDIATDILEYKIMVICNKVAGEHKFQVDGKASNQTVVYNKMYNQMVVVKHINNNTHLDGIAASLVKVTETPLLNIIILTAMLIMENLINLKIINFNMDRHSIIPKGMPQLKNSEKVKKLVEI